MIADDAPAVPAAVHVPARIAPKRPTPRAAASATLVFEARALCVRAEAARAAARRQCERSLRFRARGAASGVITAAPGQAILTQPEAPSEVLQEAVLSPADRKLRAINLGAVLVPIVGLAAAIWLSWGSAFNWLQFGIMSGMSFATALGITVGFHRLATHKSFETPAWLRFTLAALGSMAVQGPVIQWAGTHRRHHQHSDQVHDPHSPHISAEGASWHSGIFGVFHGFLHAHLGWLFQGHLKGLGKYTKDLRADPVLRTVDRQFVPLVFAGLIIPAVVAGVIGQSFTAALLGFLWGGLVRILIVHHITWSVNSVCHLWGTRPFASSDHSRNNPIVGILAFGEGWHNNHHAFPTSARHGLRWWELDISYIFIRALGLLGLARHIRVPDAHRIAAKRSRIVANDPTHRAVMHS